MDRNGSSNGMEPRNAHPSTGASHTFALQPFEVLPQLAPLAITGTISRCGQRLQILYRLQGPLDSLVIPPAAAAPARRDLLWQSTCLELFLACPGQDAYWEFNLSPAGHWNVYRLQGYRLDLAPEPAYQQLDLQVRRDPRELRLSLEIDLPPGLELDQPLQAAITAVFVQRSGLIHYWALGHGGPEPDFHRRDGFLLRL